MYRPPVSTRAIIAYQRTEGPWTGVFNDANSKTQELGRVLIRRIASKKGDLDAFVQEAIDSCPEGWALFEKNERCSDPVGVMAGTFDGLTATVDAASNPVALDTQYLYLLHVGKRRLFVFEVKNAPMRPFGMVTFDPAGKAKPTKLPPIEEPT